MQRMILVVGGTAPDRRRRRAWRLLRVLVCCVSVYLPLNAQHATQSARPACVPPTLDPLTTSTLPKKRSDEEIPRHE